MLKRLLRKDKSRESLFYLHVVSDKKKKRAYQNCGLNHLVGMYPCNPVGPLFRYALILVPDFIGVGQDLFLFNVDQRMER